MPRSNKPKTITVTFKKTEEKLYDDIMNECEIIKQADWMKIAAKEKLERDHGKKQTIQPQIVSSNFNSTTITSADDLFT
jgi:hypothetical protein